MSSSKDASHDTSLMNDDKFARKWAAPLLLGPLIPAMFSVIIIVGGSIILSRYTGRCNIELDGNFLKSTFFTTQLFLSSIFKRSDCIKLYLPHAVYMGLSWR